MYFERVELVDSISSKDWFMGEIWNYFRCFDNGVGKIRVGYIRSEVGILYRFSFI